MWEVGSPTCSLWVDRDNWPLQVSSGHSYSDLNVYTLMCKRVRTHTNICNKKNLKDVISVFGVIYTCNLTQTWDWVRKIVMSWRLVWIKLQNSQVRECVSIHARIANGQSKCPFVIITKRMVKSRGCSCVLQAKSDLLIFILPVSKESSLNS